MYGATYVLEGRQYDRAIEMLEQAQYLLPSNIAVRATLAQAYFGAGREAEARKSALSVLAWSHEESAASAAARSILEKIAEDDPDLP